MHSIQYKKTIICCSQVQHTGRGGTMSAEENLRHSYGRFHVICIRYIDRHFRYETIQRYTYRLGKSSESAPAVAYTHLYMHTHTHIYVRPTPENCLSIRAFLLRSYKLYIHNVFVMDMRTHRERREENWNVTNICYAFLLVLSFLKSLYTLAPLRVVYTDIYIYSTDVISH